MWTPCSHSINNTPQINEGTPIIQAMTVAHCILLGSSRTSRKMVFLTDGVGTGVEQIKALATLMKDDGIDIFGIAVGAGADTSLMEAISSEPKGEYSYHADNFDTLLSGNFTEKFVQGVECKTYDRCECWAKPDLLVCPLVQGILGYTCGDISTGEFYFECTDDERAAEDAAYVLWNILAWVYKFLFVMR